MQKWILCLLLGLSVISNAEAADCSVFQDKIRKLEDLRRQGGSLKQMERWRMQSDELTSKKVRCSREGSIQVASGNANPTKAKTSKSARVPKRSQKLRSLDNDDPQVQQLLSTCNYWITEYNNNPSSNNVSFRDTACRALDEKLRASDKPAPLEIANLRSLRDCIKPNNLIDNDVQECRQGLRDPIWKH
ncbi:hypothetical protein GCM10011613_24580 [Cellvibrio zantedeschiae]|uniref:Secreted protein n=1 Tax=Cellvibrio zantedeschiae TaxID=1237077 RepID=A0ABQ3B8F7_9GAMM|nr:hypothetical protein [Cellvibrio zantedeschiae]GGY78897.1 hypothetical protein GCM10011613_24580 [Cellvibrio zantedeschiae]